jgi:tRNA pseudouridine38-40 synthase
VHFDSDSKRNLFGWINGVNSQLDSSIRVKEVCLVNDDFDARFSALSRTYHYYLQIRPTASVHLHKYVGWYFQDLYLNRMQEAARLLVGRYDFSSFRASGCQANSPIREIKYLQIERRENMIKFSICANAFLHHMVRNIVGALLYVGNGKLSVAEFKNVFQAADRTKAPPTFMPQGLYLANVEYPSQIFGSSSDVWLYNG